MTILLSDPRIAAIEVAENAEPLIRLDASFGEARAAVRRSLAHRLAAARDALPVSVGFRVVEGHRSSADQRAILASYSAALRKDRPGIAQQELHQLTSRFVAPIEVAPHVAGAAVDLTLVGASGQALDLGTDIDATPEQSDGACYFDALGISVQARANRSLLARVLGEVGLVNYPTEWWHWSYGDRYWALITGEPAALYGPVEPAMVAA